MKEDKKSELSDEEEQEMQKRKLIASRKVGNNSSGGHFTLKNDMKKSVSNGGLPNSNELSFGLKNDSNTSNTNSSILLILMDSHLARRMIQMLLLHQIRVTLVILMDSHLV